MKRNAGQSGSKVKEEVTTTPAALLTRYEQNCEMCHYLISNYQSHFLNPSDVATCATIIPTNQSMKMLNFLKVKQWKVNK